MKDKMRELTNFDLFCLVNEIKHLEGARLRKVYQIGDREVRLTFQTAAGTVDLIIAPPYSMHIASKIKEVKIPTTFAMTLRKYFSGKVLQKIEQPNMDRIVLFKFHDASLVVEFFTKEFILLDQNFSIVALLQPYKRDTRIIKRGIKYAFPEMKKIQPLALPPTLPKRKGDESIDQYLLRNLNISHRYATEIGRVLEQIPETKWSEKLSKIFGRLRSPLFAIFKDGDYGIFLARAPDEIDRSFPTFSQLLEELYVREVEEKEKFEVGKELRKIEEKLRRKLEKQIEHHKSLLVQIENATRVGEKIKNESAQIEKLLEVFGKVRKEHKEQADIIRELRKVDSRVKGFEKGKIILELN